MKLTTLYETSPTAKLVSWIRRSGVDIDNDTIHKLFKFHHGISGGGRDEIAQLKAGKRLAAWLTMPVPGFDFLKYRDGYLVFPPENGDIAELITSLPGNSAIQDVIHGLAFGYGAKNVYDFSKDRALTAILMKYLKRFKVSARPAEHYRGKVYLRTPEKWVPIHRKRLEDAGIKTYDPEYPPIPDNLTKYSFAIDMPDELKYRGMPLDLKRR